MKNILFTIGLALLSIGTQAQVLYNETFDNFTLGDLSSSNWQPGQDGWYISFGSPNSSAANFQIENEPNKGKVLTIISAPVGDQGAQRAFKKGFELIWNQRTQGNNVLKFEYELFVPNYTANSSNRFTMKGGVVLSTQTPKILTGFTYNHTDGSVYGSGTYGLQGNFLFE